MIELIIYTLIAYLTNASCTLAGLMKTHPLDFHVKIKGRRLLGDGKTVEGTLIGLNTGLLFSLMLNARYGFIITLASLAGDLLGSFIKRRFGIPRGKEVPVLDQLGFIITVYIVLSFFINLELYLTLTLLGFTYIIHKLTNKLAFRLKLKSVPW